MAKSHMRSRRCPRCKRRTMHAAGQIKAGPRGGIRPVYVCARCSYRSIR